MHVDYICTCKGTKCGHNGKSKSFDQCEVIVKIPLTDGSVTYAIGKYDGEGYALVKVSGKNYMFYSRQFQNKFKKEYKERTEEGITDPAFIADEFSTFSERISAHKYDERIKDSEKVTIYTGCSENYCVGVSIKSHLKKCIPFDEKTVFQSRKEFLETKINELEESINSMKEELKKLV